MPSGPIRAGVRSGRADPASAQEQALRDAFARWASGVTIVAVRDAAGAHGLTVSAFAPISIEPPLLLVSLYADAPLLTYVQDTGRFTVNVLASEQRGLAGRFADRFPVGALPFPEQGDPVIEGALASFVCTVDAVHPAGDHRLVIGRVERAAAGTGGAPLVYFEREYRQIGT